jgi:Uma2 family endonuclease
MQLTLPERGVSVKLSFDTPQKLPLSAYLAFCRANPDLRVERTAEGEIVIMPPAGGEGSYRSGDVFGQLRSWAAKDGRGKAFDSSAEFILPDGSALSPDASWVSNDGLQRLSREQRREFLRLCPEFVVEAMSPSDRLKTVQAKMETWIANGVQLGWLIDGDAKTVHIYRKNRPPEVRRGILKLAGEGPVKGFVLRLSAIWKGLG